MQRVLQDSYGIVTTNVQTLDRYTTESTARERIVAGLSGVLGAMAALLTAVGLLGDHLFGRATHSRNRHPIALGAGRSRILRLVMGEAFLSVTVGLLVGILTAVAVTRFASSLLYGVSPTDALALATAAGVMCAVAALSTYLRRGAHYRTTPCPPSDLNNAGGFALIELAMEAGVGFLHVVAFQHLGRGLVEQLAAAHLFEPRQQISTRRRRFSAPRVVHDRGRGAS